MLTAPRLALILAGFCSPVTGSPAKAAGLAEALPIVKSGPLEQARQLLPRLARSGGMSADEQALLEAILLRREGQHARSEEILRRLLDKDPARRLVRFELARTLAAERRFTAARFQIDELINTENDARLRRIYIAFVAAILKERPWSIDAGVNVTPGTNINGGSSETVFDAGGKSFVINPASRAQAGVAAYGYVTGSYKIIVRPRWSLAIHAAGRIRKYSIASLDRQTGNAGFKLEAYVGKASVIDLDISAGLEWAPSGLVTRSISGTAQLRRRIGHAWQALATSSLTYSDAVNSKALDGISGSLSADIIYSPAAGFRVGAHAGYSFDSRGIAAFQYDGIDGRVYGYKEFGHGISVEAGIEAGTRIYRGPYPLAGFARRDRWVGAYAAITERDWAIAGFAPQLKASWSRQVSNISFYKNGSFSAAVNFTRAF